MMMHKASFVGITVTMLIFLSACNMPSQGGESAPTREAVYTAAAETVIAQLTQVAQPAATEIDSLVPESTNPPQPSEAPLPGLTATSIPAPTATLTPTVATAPDDPKLSLGDPDWRDTFEDGDNWSLYEDEHVRFRVRDDVLVMIAFGAEDRDSWMLTVPEPENYYLEVTAAPQECNGLDRYGVIFRTDATEGYLFGFSCDGQFSLRQWDGENFNDLVDWTPSEAIQPGAGQTNRMGLMVDGDQFTLFANGEQLAEASDDTYLEGGFGLFVASDETEDFRVQVSEAAYWELP
jgi:Domain of Unknown Function (DUF1080)